MSGGALRTAKRLQLFAHDGDEQFSPVWSASVLKKENPLPRPELHFSVHNRHGLASACQHHSDV